MSKKTALNLDEQGVEQAVYGSKCTPAMEMLTLTTIWTVKGVLCLIFYRLT